jgi:hypothetical protein
MNSRGKKAKRKKHKQPAAYEERGGDKKLNDKPHHINVGGKIEADFPPKLVDKYEAANTEQSAWNRKNFIAQIITITVVLIYTTIAFWQGCSANDSAKAAKTSGDLAKAALIADKRPWLGPERKPDVTLTNTEKGVQVETSLPIKVTGAPPALNVGYFMMPRAYEEVANNAKAISDNYCEMAELKPSLTDKTNLGSLGVPVFGTATITAPLPTFLSKDQHVAVIGCIAYVDQFRIPLNSPIHHTRFCFYMPYSIGEFMGPLPKVTVGPQAPMFECLTGLGAD